MILLDLSNPFTFQLRDQNGEETEIKGTFREYTKSEQKEAKDRYEKAIQRGEEAQKLARKISRNAKQIDIKEKIEDYKAVDKLFTANVKLEDELEALGSTVDMGSLDDGLVDRFETCLGGEQRDEIIQLAKSVGYTTVYAKIVEGIQTGKPDA